MHSVAVRTILFSILAGTAGAASAQAPEGEPPPHHAPPPEALAACKSASSGQECSFTAPSGDTVAGKCRAPEGKPLACRPPHHHKSPDGSPPPPSGSPPPQ